MTEINASRFVDENGSIVTIVDAEARTALQGKLDKMQGTVHSNRLLYVNEEGVVIPLLPGTGMTIGYTPSKNIFHGEWLHGRWKNGVWQPNVLNNIGIKEMLPVEPGAAYTVSNTEVSPATASLLYVNEFSDAGEWITTQNYVKYFNHTRPATFTVSAGTHFITLHVYGEGYTTLEDCAPIGLMIEKGEEATEYEPCVLNPSLDVMQYDAIAGLLNKQTVPAYYFAGNYLSSKAARIRELMDGCIGNGDAFFFLTDQHWDKNAQKSPALIKYLCEKVHIPRLFSGGDTANQGSEDYTAALSSVFGGDIHYAMGNHEYFGTADGNTLAYIHDMGKREQIGSAAEHYYFVDNPQQKLRYIVLNPFENADGTVVSGYAEEQIAWLRDTALQVEEGWTVLLFTHCLYYGYGEDASFALWPEGASTVADVLDNAACDVACVLQGHAHLDRICHTPGGIPVVTTTCDKYQPWIEGDTNREPWLSSRTAGTVTEQAFDVVVLDKTHRKLTFVRIGAPADNWTDGISTGSVEERTVTY